MRPGVRRLLRVGRTVTDLPRAIAFYRDAMGFAAGAIEAAEPAAARLFGAGRMQCATLRLGEQRLQLSAFDPPGRACVDGTAADLWFQHLAIVVPDIDAAFRRVQAQGARAITRGGPQRLPPAAGAVGAFKFRDPDGHPLELIAFPRGAGAPQWQAQAGAGGALGIDHSAISVADIERSVAFYCGLLGLREASRQLNRGPEQERLDALPDVAVEVAALQPPDAATPHVELLGYRRPRGRAAAQVSQADDVACDRLVFEVAGLDALLARLEPLPPGGVTLDDGSRAACARDPDGHLLVLWQAPAATPVA